MPVQVPIFINCRDRLLPLRQLLDWLERAGVDEIYLLDNDSRYEPLLDYYRTTPHTVVRLGENFGRLALWSAPGVFERTRARAFVYTDPDIIPEEGCPLDALERFQHFLDRFPSVSKAGFGLRIDDLPDTYPHKEAVVAWERQFWRLPVGRGGYFAPIDTTFALYRPGSAMESDAVRTGPPYVARHTSWYLDFDSLSEEEAFYQRRIQQHTEHSPRTSHWSVPRLDPGFEAVMDRVKNEHPSVRFRVGTQLRWRVLERRRLRRPRKPPDSVPAAPR